MYVCLCNGVTDRQVRRAAACGITSARGVYRSLGVAPQCGKCVTMVKSILQETSAQSDRAASCAMPAVSA